MANNTDIKNIVGKEAIKGLEKTNQELKEANTLLKEQLNIVKSLNTEYAQAKNSVQLKKTLNKQEKVNQNLLTKQKTLTKTNTALEKERIRVQQQTKKVFTQTLAAQEKGTKKLILGQERLKLVRKQAREEAQKSLGIAKKQGSIFKSLGKAIVSYGAAFLGLNAAIKIGKDLLTLFFAGTRNSADRLRIKLAGLKAQFDTLKDSIANLGDSGGDALDNVDTKAGLALKTLLFFAKTKLLGVDKAIELEVIGAAAEELERRMIKLERAEADLTLVYARRKRTISELRLLAESDNETYEVRINALKEAKKLEQEMFDDRSRSQKERISISLTEKQITDEQINAIVEQGLAIEKVGLTLSTEKERIEVIGQIRQLYEDQTQSLLKQKKLLANINTLTDEKNAKEKKALEDAMKLREGIQEITADSEKEITLTLTDELQKRYEANKAYLDKVKADDMQAAEDKKAAIQFATSEIQNISGLLFDYNQDLRDKELEALQTNYDAQIQAAGDDNEKKEALARELAKKQFEIQLKQAKSEKNQALVDIAINTAVAASKALPNVALAALTTASGLIQAGLVQSQPLPAPPQYATGKVNTPDTFIAGDPLNGSSGNSRELIFTKDGKTMLTPNHATLYQGMAGSTVLPNAQTEQVLSAINMTNAGAINTDQLENKMDALIETTKRKNLKVTIDSRGIGIGNDRLSYKANSRFRN
jgi:hypothetical protein